MNVTVVRVLASLLLCSLLCACENKRLILYEYNGVCITRVDKGNESYYYYGDLSKADNMPRSYIKGVYSGFNSGLQAFLLFKSDSTVSLIKISGSFNKSGNNANLDLVDMENLNFIHFKDSIAGSYKNAIEVFDIVNFEQEWNLKNNTEVKAVYK